jgi:hypothetical protein
MAEIPDKPHRTGAFWLDFIVATGAVIISLISLWVAQRSDSTQERLLAASVWPYVQYGTSNFANHKHEILLILRNAGVGPARIRWMTLDYRGTPIKSPYGLTKACCERNGSQSLTASLITSSVTHNVLVPHETVSFILVDKTPANAVAYNRLDHSLGHIRVHVCYCSVLDDCWLFDSGTEEDSKPVGKCPPIPSTAYDD